MLSVDYECSVCWPWTPLLQAWDDSLHPMCHGKFPPKWCKQRWCYVDPCSCNLKAPPKVTMYLPEATFTGKSLYYSYETCGSEDHFTEKYNVEACVNQKTKAARVFGVGGCRLLFGVAHRSFSAPCLPNEALVAADLLSDRFGAGCPVVTLGRHLRGIFPALGPVSVGLFHRGLVDLCRVSRSLR